MTAWELTGWEVAYVHRSAYEGVGESAWESSERSRHRTWLGADWYRRFRYRPMTMGFRWVETVIVRPGTVLDPAAPAPSPGPRIERFMEERVWRPLYWLRGRWDGIRYGLNRDERP